MDISIFVYVHICIIGYLSGEILPSAYLDHEILLCEYFMIKRPPAHMRIQAYGHIGICVILNMPIWEYVHTAGGGESQRILRILNTHIGDIAQRILGHECLQEWSGIGRA